VHAVLCCVGAVLTTYDVLASDVYHDGAPGACHARPRLHYRLLTLCPAPTDPVGQSWPCVCIYVCMCARAYVRVRRCACTCTCTCTRACTRVCVRVCVCVCHQRVPMAPLHLTLLLPLTCRGMAWWRACVCGNAARLLRGSKKYKPVPSPLLRLHFWRVCLDEAQMVENTTAKAAEMASKLHSGTRCPVLPPPVPGHTRRACASSCAPAPLLLLT